MAPSLPTHPKAVYSLKAPLSTSDTPSLGLHAPDDTQVQQRGLEATTDPAAIEYASWLDLLRRQGAPRTPEGGTSHWPTAGVTP
jgi:hypothetical protein